MAKHKHADLIKAWADGAQIQMKRYDGSWVELDPPSWSDSMEYRIKPEPELSLPYRLCLLRTMDGTAVVGIVHCPTMGSDRAAVESRRGRGDFIRWVSDWKQEEV